MKICPNCGASNTATARFCYKCGASLESIQSHSSKNSGDTNSGTHNQTSPLSQPQVPQKHHGCLWLIILLVIALLAGGGYWAYSSGLVLTPKVGSHHMTNKAKDSSEASRLKKENKRLKSQSQQNSGSSSSKTEFSSNVNSQDKTQTSSDKVVPLTASQKSSIANDFTSWAAQRASMGNMAVSDWYFDHGSAGNSDWTAMTPDGKVLVQDEGNPGSASYKLQAIGGVVFYKADDGTTGLDNSLSSGSTADGYSTNMDFSQDVSKYLLVNNGVVYQLKLSGGSEVSPETGFSNGDGGGDGSHTFQPSQDEAAQSELRQLISTYSNH